MKKYFIVVFFFLTALNINCEEIEFTASIDADMIGLEDYLIYTVTYKGIQNPAPPDVSDIDDFNIIQTSRSSEFKFINGVSSSFINFIYYLAPLKEGTLVIPPLKYLINKKVLKTRGFKIIAVKGSIKKVKPKTRKRSIFDLEDDFSPFGASPSGPDEIDVKLKAIVPKTKIFVGEQLIYKILLYSRNRIESVNLVSGQSFPGFWQEWYPVKRSIDGRSEIIDGKNYQVYEIRKAVLFPAKAGKLVLPSVRFDLSLADRSFSFFSNSRKITRSTNEINVNVNNIPHDNGSLPVGQFKLFVEVDKRTIDINELLIIKIKVRGFGNIKTIKIPEFTSNGSFKLFPSRISRKMDHEENGIRGTIAAEVPVSFKTAGIINFPSLNFKYFDPVSEEVKISKSDLFSIEVTGSREKTSKYYRGNSSSILKKGTDIDFIKKGSINDQSKFLYQGVIYRIIIVLLVLFVISLFTYDFLIKKYLLESRAFRGRRKQQQILKKLNEIKEYGEIFQVMEEYVAEKTKIRKSEINNTKIENLFYSSGIRKKDTDTFLRIRSESELSRFSPSTIKTNSQEKDDISLLKEIIKRIDSKLK